MKIIRIEPQENWPKVYTLRLEFDKATGHLTGDAGTHSLSGDLITDFDINLNDWVGKLVEVRIGMSENGFEVFVFDALKNYAMGNGMPGASEVRSKIKVRLFRIFVHENLEDSIIQIHNAHEAIPGFEDIVEDGDFQLRMYNMARRDEKLEHVLKMHRLKSKMLGCVDQRDSVSYLEAQVDILTRLVLALHKDDHSSLTNILREADKNSVLTIKGEEALANEFTKKKAWVRTVQKDYYEEKAKLEASAP